MRPREVLERLGAAFDNLSGRERVLVAGAGGVLLLTLVWALVVLPALRASANASRRVEAAEQQLAAMTRLRRQFDEVKLRLADVEQRVARGGRGNLRTTLENLARQSGVKIESMEPQASPANDRYRETKVELGLEGVSLEQAVRYLHRIESHTQVLSVKSLRIRRRADRPELLDVSFTVSSFEPVSS